MDKCVLRTKWDVTPPQHELVEMIDGLFLLAGSARASLCSLCEVIFHVLLRFHDHFELLTISQMLHEMFVPAASREANWTKITPHCIEET